MNIVDKIRYKIVNCNKRCEILKKQGVTIGKGCEIYPNVEFGSEPYLVKLGDNVRITSGCKFITHDGGVWVIRKIKGLNNIDLFGRIDIGNNVHIGCNTIIMPNVNIGNNCIIGCGAVVTKDIPDNSVAVGVPARVIKSIDEYYEKNKEKYEQTKGLNAKQKKAYLCRKYDIQT